MKAALHRSLTFWFGLLVMGFICWAWWDTATTSSEWRHCQDSNNKLCLTHENSTLHITHWRVRSKDVVSFPQTARLGETDRSSCPPDSWDGWLTAPDAGTFFVGPAESIELRQLVLPHWLILLAVAALWLGLLFWRARRRAKAAENRDPGEYCGDAPRLKTDPHRLKIATHYFSKT